MALSSIVSPPDPRRDARAAELVDSVASWPRYRLNQPFGAFEAGTEFRRAPSSKNDGTRYLVNAVACQCPDYAESFRICKHIRAYVMFEAQQTEGATSATPAPERIGVADANDLDGTRGHLDRLQARRTRRVRIILAEGNDPDDDGEVAQLSEWIERLERRISAVERIATPVGPSRVLTAAELANE